MVQQYAEVFWAILFLSLLAYTLWRTLIAPLLVKRFYAKIHFVDRGQSRFDAAPHSSSVLLSQLQTFNVYGGDYHGQRVEQFMAMPKDAHKFTFSRAKRKQNTARWTVTLIYPLQPITSFCARPVRAPDALAYLLDSSKVSFAEDESFANRVHVLATDHERAKPLLLSPKVRDFLDNIDPVSLESTDTLLIVKGPRQPHDAGSKLKAELDQLLVIYQTLRCVLTACFAAISII